jgi:hypothetical protein
MVDLIFMISSQSDPTIPESSVTDDLCSPLLKGDNFVVVRGYLGLREVLQTVRKHRVCVVLGGEDVGRFARGEDADCLFCVWKCGQAVAVDLDELRKAFDSL